MKRHALFFEPPLENNYWGHIFEEVYKSGLYYPFLPSTPKDKVALDIGGNVGIVSYFFHDKFETVYTIEPSSDHFETLNTMLKFNEIKNVKPFQFALSNTDGETDFFHYDNKTMNSLYGTLDKAADASGSKIVQTAKEKVTIKRLDTFFREQKIEHVDLMKIDVEGVEYEILCGDGFLNVADRIDAIVGEVHAFSGRDPNQIKDALESKGFQFAWHPHDAQLFVARR